MSNECTFELLYLSLGIRLDVYLKTAAGKLHCSLAPEHHFDILTYQTVNILSVD